LETTTDGAHLDTTTIVEASRSLSL